MANRSPSLRAHARAMRKEPTRAEDRIWAWLRNRRFAGMKFRRQVPIGRYIVDFYCVELKLAIELDGSQHQAVWMVDYDSERTRYLISHGIQLLRIPNELLIRDSILVGEQISAIITERLTAAACANETPSSGLRPPSPPCAGEKTLGGGVTRIRMMELASASPVRTVPARPAAPVSSGTWPGLFGGRALRRASARPWLVRGWRR
jgi:very-short-patch-repair endonuclease